MRTQQIYPQLCPKGLPRHHQKGHCLSPLRPYSEEMFISNLWSDYHPLFRFVYYSISGKSWVSRLLELDNLLIGNNNNPRCPCSVLLRAIKLSHPKGNHKGTLILTLPIHYWYWFVWKNSRHTLEEARHQNLWKNLCCENVFVNLENYPDQMDVIHQQMLRCVVQPFVPSFYKFPRKWCLWVM